MLKSIESHYFEKLTREGAHHILKELENKGIFIDENGIIEKLEKY